MSLGDFDDVMNVDPCPTLAQLEAESRDPTNEEMLLRLCHAEQTNAELQAELQVTRDKLAESEARAAKYELHLISTNDSPKSVSEALGRFLLCAFDVAEACIIFATRR